MVNVSRTFTVLASQELAVDYLADFGNAVEWDPGTVSCTRIDGGALAPGARWRNVSKFLGRETELSYTLVEKRPDGVVLVGSNKTATSVDDVRVTPAHAGSRIVYNATIRFHGMAKLVDPLMRLVFERLAAKTAEQMTQALNRRTQQASG
jgi:carbon monoxide dehydrogenase subunit G